MALFGDLFSGGYNQAAGAASTGYQAGYNNAAPLYDAGRGVLGQDAAAALNANQPVTKSANAGASTYASALGIGGDPAKIQALLAATPGYQFNLDTGLKAIDRGAASRGLTTSGNTIEAEQNYGANLANQTYQNYVNNLQPYLGQQTAAANTNAGIYTGLGSALNSSYGNEGNLAFNTQAAIGNAQASADVAGQNADNSFISGVLNLGGKLLGSKTASAAAPSSGNGGLY